MVDLVASVPSSAISTYGASQLLKFASVRQRGEHPRDDERGVEKVAYFGDASGDGTLSGTDASLISRNVVHLDNGFSAYPLTDPLIIADVTGDGTLSGLDASYVAQKVVHYSVPQIPDVPSHGSLTQATVDPTVSVALGTIGIPGTTANVPVSITDDASGLASADLTFDYDTSRLSLTNAEVTLNSELQNTDGWAMSKNVVGNTVYISAYSLGSPLPSGTGPQQLLNMAFQVLPNAPAGTAAVTIDTSGTPPNSRLNEGNLVLTPVNGSVVIGPPEVANVEVGSTSWSASYVSGLQTAGLGDGNGYAVPTGAAQMNTLPWANLNQIQVTFNEPVNVQESNLSVTGVNVPSYAFSGFSYNPATFTATWKLTSPIGTDKVTITLNSVTNANGDALDGEWTNGVSQFPSGNGGSGGNGSSNGSFVFNFNVLPGDLNQDGIVNGQDIAKVASHWLQSNLFLADGEGIGIINGQDIAPIASHWLQTSPAGGGSGTSSNLLVDSGAGGIADATAVAPSIGSSGIAASLPPSTSSGFSATATNAVGALSVGLVPPTGTSFSGPQGVDHTASFVGNSRIAAVIDSVMSQQSLNSDHGASLKPFRPYHGLPASRPSVPRFCREP